MNEYVPQSDGKAADCKSVVSARVQALIESVGVRTSVYHLSSRHFANIGNVDSS